MIAYSLYLVFGLVTVVWLPKVNGFLWLSGLFFGSIVALASDKREEIVPEEDVPASMTLRNPKGMVTGTDRGQLIECDGWLLFEGSRTSFTLTATVAQRGRYDPAGHLRLNDGRTVEFGCPIGMPEGSPSIEQVLRSWARAPIPDGEPILPPTPIHPGVWSDRWTGAIFGSVGFSFLLGLGLLLHSTWIWVPGLLGAGVALAIALSYARVLRRELPQAFEEPRQSRGRATLEETGGR